MSTIRNIVVAIALCATLPGCGYILAWHALDKFEDMHKRELQHEKEIQELKAKVSDEQSKPK